MKIHFEACKFPNKFVFRFYFDPSFIIDEAGCGFFSYCGSVYRLGSLAEPEPVDDKDGDGGYGKQKNLDATNRNGSPFDLKESDLLLLLSYHSGCGGAIYRARGRSPLRT